MSYPPPPGLKSFSNQPPKSSSPHPSLPARPPPSSLPTTPSYTSPAFSHGGPNAPPRNPSYGAYQAFAPRQVAQAPAAYPAYQQPQAYPQQYPQQSYYDQSATDPNAAYGAPVIRNPFAPPGQAPIGGARGGYESVDPEYEAQIAQWQSAYAGKDASADASKGKPGAYNGYNNASTGAAAGSATNANLTPVGTKPEMTSSAVASAVSSDTGVATVVSGADGKQKTVVRSGGGTTWTDSTLLEWDPSHFRLFVGNLAGEVTDESLLKAFSRWPSVQKARVVRDKRTTKSKGFGFVSFSDGDEFFQAARDMQGKYIGSHPVLLKKSTTEIKAVTPRDNKKGGKNNKGKGGKNNSAGGHANTGAGVQKAGQKTKGGLKILG